MINERKIKQLQRTENEGISKTVVTNRYLAVLESNEMYPDLDPRIARNQQTVSQMDILHQKLIKFWSRDTMICERFLGMWTPTPPKIKLWRTKIRFYPAGHRKRSLTTTAPKPRDITCWCENEVFEKASILA